MQIQIDSRRNDSSSAHSQTPLPEASDATVAAIIALMLRRTKIKSARQTDEPDTQGSMQAAKGYLDSRSEY